MKTLINRYDTWNAARNVKGADGKIGQITEMNAFVTAVQSAMPQTEGTGAVPGLPRRR
jgi:hypothetical protein